MTMITISVIIIINNYYSLRPAMPVMDAVELVLFGSGTVVSCELVQMGTWGLTMTATNHDGHKQRP